jgi:hypothetical protein
MRYNPPAERDLFQPIIWDAPANKNLDGPGNEAIHSLRKRYTLNNDKKGWTAQTMRRLAHRNKEYIVQLVRRYKTANGNRDPVLMVHVKII